MIRQAWSRDRNSQLHIYVLTPVKYLDSLELFEQNDDCYCNRKQETNI